MNDDLYQAEKVKYERMHAVPGYSVGPGEGYVDSLLKCGFIKPGETIIDFGCGTGDAARKFADKGHLVMVVDIVRDALRPEHGLDDRFFLASLHELPANLPRADWGFCSDVMEHLPEKWVDSALAGIRKKVDKCFFSISGNPDGWGALIGEKLHLTVKPFAWWEEKIKKYWPVVDRLNTEDTVFIMIASKGGC